MKTNSGLVLTVLGIFLSVTAALAHETWLEPSSFHAQVRESVVFSLTSGMQFPQLDYAIKPERIAQAHYREGGKVFPLRPERRAKSALLFRQTFPQPGEVMAWVTLHPKRLELSEAKVLEYFDEIDAPAELRATWAKRKGATKWRETYTKCAKTFLAVGHSPNEQRRMEPVGMPLEIVPSSDPTGWRAGQNIEVRLLENGKPLAGVSLGLIVGTSGRVFQTTDGDGRASFPLAHAGPALLFAVDLRWHEEKQEWESRFTTFAASVEK